jgi:CDP-diacylglycerol--glycerol-3-phosphate 3-phosphatidyltransferase
MNLPNGLTLSRIFLVPLLVTVLLTKYDVRIAATIFLAASMTDLLDGYLARKRGQVTTLGTLLDPVADKLLISSASYR